jgi:hypothetical protein
MVVNFAFLAFRRTMHLNRGLFVVQTRGRENVPLIGILFADPQ